MGINIALGMMQKENYFVMNNTDFGEHYMEKVVSKNQRLTIANAEIHTQFLHNYLKLLHI